MASKISSSLVRFVALNHMNIAGKQTLWPSISSSRLAFHSSSAFRCTSNVGESSSNDSTQYTTRDSQGKRISSEVFWLAVKKTMEAELGKEVPIEEFIPPSSAIEALSKEYDSLLEDLEEFKDKYRRALAETENVRRRGMKQVEDAKIFAIQGFCKDLLEIADTLDLALEKSKVTSESSPDFKNLYEGVSMTKNVLLNTFKKHGLIPVNPEGQKFDPNMHEAIFEVPKEQTKYESGYVAHVMKIGYSLHDRPVRAAQVGVVKMS